MQPAVFTPQDDWDRGNVGLDHGKQGQFQQPLISQRAASRWYKGWPRASDAHGQAIDFVVLVLEKNSNLGGSRGCLLCGPIE